MRKDIIVARLARVEGLRFEVRARNDYFDLAPVRHAYRNGRRSAPA